MHAEDRVARKAVEQPVRDHRRAAAEPLLGRLEDQMHGAVEIAGLGEIARRAEQHRRVPVMAAGMHAPGMSASGREGWSPPRSAGIHVGAQPDRARRIAGAQPADDTGLADAAKHLDAEFGEPLRDKIGGPLLLEAELGMGVDVVPPFRQLVVKFRDTPDDRHARLPPSLAALSPSRWLLAIRLAHRCERAIVTAGMFREE